MQFLKFHPEWFAASLLLAIVLVILRPAYERTNVLFLKWGENQAVLLGMWLLFAIFYVAGYLTKPVFYTGYMGGTVGDNYMYVYKSLSDFAYCNPQHLYFPFIPGQLLRLLIHSDVILKSDPHFLEKVFLFYSLPNRLLSLIGFWAFHRMMRRLDFTPFEAFLGVLFLATSFGYWFWALQSNAMGFLLPSMLLALYCTQMALETGKMLYWGMAPFLLALCFFVHISSVYVVASMGSYLLIIGITRYVATKSRMALGCISLYCLTVLAAGTCFFLIIRSVYGSRSLSEYEAILAGNWSLGVFSFKAFLSYFVRDGISTNVTELLGLLQARLRSPIEASLIIVQLACMLFLVLGIVRSRFPKVSRDITSWPFLYALLISFLASVAGFSTRKTWFQYYVAIVPVSALLFTTLALSKNAWKGRGGNSLAFAFLIISNMAINGFSSTRVTMDRQVTDQIVYRTLSMLKSMAGNQSACFVGPSKTYPYNFFWLSRYYSHPFGPFSHIKWFTDVDQRDQGTDDGTEFNLYDPASSFHKIRKTEAPKEPERRGMEACDIVFTDPQNSLLLSARWPYQFNWERLETGNPDFPVLLKSIRNPRIP